MIKIKISYEKPEELQQIIKLLSPVIKSYKVPKEQKEKYKRAYLSCTGAIQEPNKT